MSWRLRNFVALLVASMGCWIERQAEVPIEYLKTENRLLRSRLGRRRILFSDAERRTLATLAKEMGTEALVSPATLLRWDRQLLAQNMLQESRFYCQPYCRRQGNGGDAGDYDLLRISKLLIPKSLRVVQKPIEGSNPSLSARRHLKFPSDSITQSWQPRSEDSNPRYGKGGSTKSRKAILDDAHASPEGRPRSHRDQSDRLQCEPEFNSTTHRNRSLCRNNVPPGRCHRRR